MSRIDETLAEWRELERARDALADETLRAALEVRIAETKAAYQAEVQAAEERHPLDPEGSSSGP